MLRVMPPRHTAQSPEGAPRWTHLGPVIPAAIAAGGATTVGLSQGQDTSWWPEQHETIQQLAAWHLIAELGRRFLVPSTSYHKSESCQLN